MLLIFFLSFSALADSQLDSLITLKSNTPDTLGYYISVSEKCEFSEEDIEQIVQGVFIRSRIKPSATDWISLPEFYLSAVVQCVPLKNNNPVINFDVKWDLSYRDLPNGTLYLSRDKNYGSLGIGPKEYLSTSIKNAIERAITDYVKANFLSD